MNGKQNLRNRKQRNAKKKRTDIVTEDVQYVNDGVEKMKVKRFYFCGNNNNNNKNAWDKVKKKKK